MTQHPAAQTIESIYRERTPKSAAYHERASRVLPGGDSRTITYFTPHPLYIERGQGPCMTDVDGNEYLDFLGNYTSMIHGHGHPAVAEAIARQSGLGSAYGACTPSQIELAEEITRRVASVDQVRFCNSGTEATMNAIRAARALTGRMKILKAEGGYHGSHDLVEVSVAPDAGRAGAANAPQPVPDSLGIPDAVVQDVVVIPFNDSPAAEAAFARCGGEIAAVIVEPMLGASGTIPATREFLAKLRRLCDEYGSLLIFDEVITFRLDMSGMQGLYEVMPDLTAFGKIIGGGLPVGAFGGQADVMALFAPPEPRMVQSGTYNANPLTMAAGVASMRLLTPDAIARINELGERLSAGLRGAFDEMRIAGQVTGQGSLCTIHFTDQPVSEYRSMAASHHGAQRLMHLALLNRGIFTAKRGMFVVSTAMDERDIDAASNAFADSLNTLRPYIREEAPHLLL